MTASVHPLGLRDVLHVCENMRASDWVEIVNLLPRAIDTAETIAMTVMSVSSFGFVVRAGNEPVCVVQFAQILEGTWRAGLFATDRFPEVWRTVVKEITDAAVPYLLDKGAVYCEAYADVTHAQAHHLLRRLGFHKRTILEGYGSRGRDIALFVSTERDQNDVHGRGIRRPRQSEH